MKPLLPHAEKILLQIACQKADELLIEMATEREKKILLGQIVDGIIVHIRTHQLIDPVPRTRQVCSDVNPVKSYNFTLVSKSKSFSGKKKLFVGFKTLSKPEKRVLKGWLER